MKKIAIIIDVAIPGDKKIIDKEQEKTEKHQNLKREIQRLWNLKKIDVIPVVLGVLGSVTNNFEKYVDKIGIEIDLHTNCFAILRFQGYKLLTSCLAISKILILRALS